MEEPIKKKERLFCLNRVSEVQWVPDYDSVFRRQKFCRLYGSGKLKKEKELFPEASAARKAAIAAENRRRKKRRRNG